MNGKRFRRYLLSPAVGLWLVLHAPFAAGQAIFESTVAGQPIPKHYQSWSIFLICNPQWLMSENDAKLSGLHQQFRSFGHAIGASHLAVWFWKRAPAPGRPVADNIDVDRNAAMCAKLKLLPSRSPYVVVTTQYPEADSGEVMPEVLIELNNLAPPDIGSLLNRLADQLLVQGLRQADFDSEQYWTAWRRSAESLTDVLAAMVKKVKLTINTALVKLEIEGGSE